MDSFGEKAPQREKNSRSAGQGSGEPIGQIPRKPGFRGGAHGPERVSAQLQVAEDLGANFLGDGPARSCQGLKTKGSGDERRGQLGGFCSHALLCEWRLLLSVQLGNLA